MPASRARSCHHCRLAKARCSLQNPCSRCSKRQLECSYALPLVREDSGQARSLRAIRPAADPVTSDRAHNSPDIESATTLLTPFDPDVSAAESEFGYAGPESLALNTRQDLHDSRMPTASDECIITDYAGYGVDARPSIGCPNIPVIGIPPYSTAGDVSSPYPPATGLRGENSSTTHRLSSLLSTLDPSLLFSRNVVQAPQLVQRGRSLQQGSLTAKILLTQLANYTRMMADCRQFPPFIHPPCCFNGGSQCSTNARHQCLPPILSTCAGLVRACYTGNLDSKPVWDSIKEHLDMMIAEHELYDEQTMLEATQGAVLYALLCAQCLGGLSSMYSGLVVTSVETFGKRLFSMVPWGLEAEVLSIFHEQWILVESIRRLGCILYIIDLLLQIDLQETPSRGKCETFWELPLPCYREMWQSSPVDIRVSTSRHHLTLGQLLMLRQSKRLDEVIANTGGSTVAEELAEWCERADDLSMLLWIALIIEGEGQSSGKDVAV